MLKSITNSIPLSYLYYYPLLAWMTFGVQTFLHFNPRVFGILPRDVQGLIGILTSGFVHNSLDHLIANSFPLVILIVTLIYLDGQRALKIVLIGYLGTTLAVWLFGRSGVVHLGASGFVFYLVSYLIVLSYFRKGIVVLLVVIFFTLAFSSMFQVLLLPNENTSWEAHTFGFIIGIIVSIWMNHDSEEQELVP